MKKILSVLLIICMLFSLSLTLASCKHECEFFEAWSKDDDSHWHTCIEDGCYEFSNKADHDWDEGVVTVKATKEADGVRTFTCNVCSHIKNEPIEYTCEISSDWTVDETSHWHACIDTSCEEISDKAEHTWDAGKVTTNATQDSDGIKTFTCTTCKHTRSETIVFTGMSKEEWKAAFDASVFENFSCTEVVNTSTTGILIVVEALYKFTSDDAYIKVSLAGVSEEAYAPDAASAQELREEIINELKNVTSYTSYEYDNQTKTYKATEDIYFSDLEESTSDVTLTFKDGKLYKLEYSGTTMEDGVELTYSAIMTFSDYGSVVLAPQVSTEV